MGILSSSVISQSNLYAKHRIEARLQELEQKLIDLQEYSATISNTSISLNSMADAPASMFGRLTKFMMNADSVATQNAQQKYMFMQQTPNAIPGINYFNGDAQAQQLYQWQLQNSLYESEREKMIQAETKKLAAEETKIEAEKTQLTKHLDMIKEQMKNENDSYKDSVSQFFQKG